MGVFVTAALFLVLAAVASCQLSPEQENKIFSDYLIQYKIRLGRSDNIEKSKKILIDRYNKIENHNANFRAGKTSYELGLDEYSLLSDEQLVRQRTGLLPRPDNSSDLRIPAENDNRRSARSSPAQWDWRQVSGVVRPVQNQGSCGSCWAFAGIGALEGQLSKLKNRHDKLSEQEVLECARSPWDGRLLGCSGGWDFSVYDHARERNGVTFQSNRPYKSNTASGCNVNTPRVPGSKTAEVTYFKLSAGNEEQMKEYLYNVGPLYVTYYVSSDFYNYRSGVYTDSRRYCGNYYNNHGVLLVGYGTQGGLDYWLVKNSWGTNWGESGYFKIQRGKNLCGIAKDVSYPRLE